MQGSRRNRAGTYRSAVLAVTVALVGSLAIASTASAALLIGGTTTLEVKKGIAKKLKKGGVKIKPAAGAQKSGKKFTFSIVGGDLDRGDQNSSPTSASGTVRHDAGLKFKCKGGKVKVTELLASFGSSSTLAGTSKGSQLMLANLKTNGARVTNDGLNVANVKVKAAKQFRKQLKKQCGVDVKKKTLGKLHVDASAELTVFDGTTSLAPDGAFVLKLFAMGVAPSPIAPSTFDGVQFTFPVTGGKVNPDTFVGEITHDGGITLTEGPVVAPLEDPTVLVTGPSGGTLTLFSVAQGTRASLFDVTFTAPPQVSGNQLTANAELHMNAVAAAALNDAFSQPGDPTFSAGELVGTATVTATIG